MFLAVLIAFRSGCSGFIRVWALCFGEDGAAAGRSCGAAAAPRDGAHAPCWKRHQRPPGAASPARTPRGCFPVALGCGACAAAGASEQTLKQGVK